MKPKVVIAIILVVGGIGGISYVYNRYIKK